MPEHERFQEMCAAASIGQLPPDQLALLGEHIADCAGCRSAYADYSHIAGLEYSLREHDTALNPAEANKYLDSTLLRSRFLSRAEHEGIIFSEQVDRIASQSKIGSFPLLAPTRVHALVAIAAGVMLMVSASLILYHVRRNTVSRVSVVTAVQQPVVVSRSISNREDQRLRDSLARQEELESQVSALQVELRVALERMSRTQAVLEERTEDERQVTAERDSQRQSLEDLKQQLNQAEVALRAARQEASEAQSKSDGMQAAFVADQVQIHDLSDQVSEKAAELDRERRMLQAGREVRDLMAARNLHIVDVFDTDPRGKTKPIFGRVFFTEGKSLVFYAYDLNDTKIEKGGQYRVWGTKEGQEKQAWSLGIFYSDDKAQRRWVLKYSDPKVLDEIDSVFVTLEQPGDNSLRPKGQKLMDAYLRAQPNHP